MSINSDPVASAKTSDGSVDQQAVTGGELSVASLASTTPNGSARRTAEAPRLQATATGSLTLNALAFESHERAKRKGFYDPPPSVPERLCLIHSEVSEALEAFRDDAIWTTVNERGKPEGLASELADIVIRVADFAAYMGIDLEREVRLKSDYNETRPHKHGRKVM